MNRRIELTKEYEELCDELKKIVDKKTMKLIKRLVSVSEELEAIYFNS